MSKRAHIVVESDFRGYAARLEREIEHGMGRGMAHVVAAARATPVKSRRADGSGPYDVDSIKAQIGVSRPKRPKGTRGGLVSTVIIRDWRGLWFELGTLGRRRRKLHRNTVRRRETASGQERYSRVEGHRGVKAQRMLGNGERVGWPGFLREIQAALRRVSQ